MMERGNSLCRSYNFNSASVTAPSEALVTWAAYWASTPRVWRGVSCLFGLDFTAQEPFQFTGEFQFLRPVPQVVFVQGVGLHRHHTRRVAKLPVRGRDAIP